MKYPTVIDGKRMPQSPPSRGAWIEIMLDEGKEEAVQSPPSRGAWIEMLAYSRVDPTNLTVAPLAGGVD